MKKEFDLKAGSNPGLDIESVKSIIENMINFGIICSTDIDGWLNTYCEIESPSITWKGFLNALQFGIKKEEKEIYPLEWNEIDYETAKSIANEKFEKAKELEV